MKVFVMAGAALLLATSSHAASVSVETGTALLRSGNGKFKSITSGTVTAQAGQKIVVRDNSVVVLSYGGACTVRLPAGIWHVSAEPPCKDSASIIDFTTRMNQAGPTGDAADMPVDGDSVVGAGGANMTPWIIGGLVVAGGVGLAIAVSNNGKKDKRDFPASP